MKSFDEILNGQLYGVLQWAQWDALCSQVRNGGQAGISRTCRAAVHRQRHAPAG